MTGRQNLPNKSEIRIKLSDRDLVNLFRGDWVEFETSDPSVRVKGFLADIGFAKIQQILDDTIRNTQK